MGWLSLASLVFRAILLVTQWMHDRQVAGVAREQALRELTDALNERIARAAAARAAPHDNSVHDPHQRD